MTIIANMVTHKLELLIFLFSRKINIPTILKREKKYVVNFYERERRNDRFLCHTDTHAGFVSLLQFFARGLSIFSLLFFHKK